MSGSTTTTTGQKAGIRINASLLAENPGQAKNLATRRDLTPAGTVTFFGVPVSAFERTYESRGVTRRELHLAIGRDGTEEILKADIAIRAKELASREDNPAIGYRASTDQNVVLGYYKELWQTMNTIRNTWYPNWNDRPRWDNRSTHGLSVQFPEFDGEKYYILADRCRNELVLLRRMTGDEYDARAAAREDDIAAGGDAGDDTIALPDW